MFVECFIEFCFRACKGRGGGRNNLIYITMHLRVIFVEGNGSRLIRYFNSVLFKIV